MEKDILKKLEEITETLKNKQKSWLDNLSSISSILVPLVIAFVGLYFTTQYNKNQLTLQKKISEEQRKQDSANNAAQMHLAYTKLLMENITGSDVQKRDFAIKTILYIDSTFGKVILAGLAKSTNSATAVAAKALTDNVVLNLFSKDKPTRVTAADEINSNLQTDQTLINIITTANSALTGKIIVSDLKNGIFNCLIVMNDFPISLLNSHKAEIGDLGKLLGQEGPNTSALFNQMARKLQIPGI